VRPLEGIRVLDLSRVVSGPSCTRALCDLGADVIKIEPPEGDVTRQAHPRFGGISVYFAQVNCGKRCVCLDLGKAEARRLALELAVRSDVVVENFRPGVMERLGLGYPAVRARNPRAVYCSITGYGQSGPSAHRRAYAPVIHAELGLLELGARGRGLDPMPEPVSHADFAVGALAAQAVLAALLVRERTGRGQHLDVSMAETMLAMNEWTSVEVNGGAQGKLSVFNPSKAAVVRLADGTFVQIPGNPAAVFAPLCRALGKEKLLEEPRFSDIYARDRHMAEVLALIRAWAAEFADFESFDRVLGAQRIAIGAVKRLGDVADEPWARERGAFVELDAGDGGAYRLPRSPFRFSESEVGLRGRPAAQGEHNREVMRELLGLADAELDRLEAEGVLTTWRKPGST
jgi:crotonobetainyl-CoA:carnitine CoA-transferase CaiB-like acyl-CoA transferase